MLNGDEASHWQRQMQRKQQADSSDRTGAADKFWLNTSAGGGCRYQLRTPRLLTPDPHALGSLLIQHSLTPMVIRFPYYCFSLFFKGGRVSFHFHFSAALCIPRDVYLRHIHPDKLKISSHNTLHTIPSSSYNNTTTQPLHPPPSPSPVFASSPLPPLPLLSPLQIKEGAREGTITLPRPLLVH